MRGRERKQVGRRQRRRGGGSEEGKEEEKEVRRRPKRSGDVETRRGREGERKKNEEEVGARRRAVARHRRRRKNRNRRKNVFPISPVSKCRNCFSFALARKARAHSWAGCSGNDCGFFTNARKKRAGSACAFFNGGGASTLFFSTSLSCKFLSSNPRGRTPSIVHSSPWRKVPPRQQRWSASWLAREVKKEEES